MPTVFDTWKAIRRLANLASRKGLREPETTAYLRRWLMTRYPGMPGPQADAHIRIVKDGGPWPQTTGIEF